MSHKDLPLDYLKEAVEKRQQALIDLGFHKNHGQKFIDYQPCNMTVEELIEKIFKEKPTQSN